MFYHLTTHYFTCDWTQHCKLKKFAGVKTTACRSEDRYLSKFHGSQDIKHDLSMVWQVLFCASCRLRLFVSYLKLSQWICGCFAWTRTWVLLPTPPSLCVIPILNVKNTFLSFLCHLHILDYIIRKLISYSEIAYGLYNPEYIFKKW